MPSTTDLKGRPTTNVWRIKMKTIPEGGRKLWYFCVPPRGQDNYWTRRNLTWGGKAGKRYNIDNLSCADYTWSTPEERRPFGPSSALSRWSATFQENLQKPTPWRSQEENKIHHITRHCQLPGQGDILKHSTKAQWWIMGQVRHNSLEGPCQTSTIWEHQTCREGWEEETTTTPARSGATLPWNVFSVVHNKDYFTMHKPITLNFVQ